MSDGSSNPGNSGVEVPAEAPADSSQQAVSNPYSADPGDAWGVTESAAVPAASESAPVAGLPLPAEVSASPEVAREESDSPPPPFALRYERPAPPALVAAPPAAAPLGAAPLAAPPLGAPPLASPQWLAPAVASPPPPPAPAYSAPTYAPLPTYVPPTYPPPTEVASGAHAYPEPAQQAGPAPLVPGPTQWYSPPPATAPAGTEPQPYIAPPVEAPPVPRPEDLLVPNRTSVAEAPASWGWRGRLRALSGGLVKLQAAPAELAARQAIVDIQRGFSRPMTVVVIQPKGGAGKTPTTICLSAAFGAHRGGYVVGWDDNETRGTLAVRVTNPDAQQATVWDLLSDLESFERFDARVGDLSYYVRPQAEAHFDALVSDDNPANMAQIGEDEFERLHTVLQRFYRMIVVDTGNNVRSPNWQAAVNAADLVVLVSTYQRDVGYSGSWVLDHLAQTGREELANNAVTVLTAADPTTDKTVREQLLAHFTARTRAVVEVPYDPQIAAGGPIRWNALAEQTRNAWVIAGAVIVNALAEHDQRARAARRG